jgi:glycogen operon protein
MGDEFGHSQRGNNNAYCQDNEISWLNWELEPAQKDLLDFFCQVMKFWQEQPVFKRRQFFQGRQIRGDLARDILWLAPSGKEMTDSDWHSGAVRCLGLRLEGEMLDETDERGNHIVGDSVLMIMNAHHQSIDFTLPKHEPHEYWQPQFDTRAPKGKKRWLTQGFRYQLVGRSLAVLQLKRVRVKTMARVVKWFHEEEQSRISTPATDTVAVSNGVPKPDKLIEPEPKPIPEPVPVSPAKPQPAIPETVEAKEKK